METNEGRCEQRGEFAKALFGGKRSGIGAHGCLRRVGWIPTTASASRSALGRVRMKKRTAYLLFTRRRCEMTDKLPLTAQFLAAVNRRATFSHRLKRENRSDPDPGCSFALGPVWSTNRPSHSRTRWRCRIRRGNFLEDEPRRFGNRTAAVGSWVRTFSACYWWRRPRWLRMQRTTIATPKAPSPVRTAIHVTSE